MSSAGPEGAIFATSLRAQGQSRAFRLFLRLPIRGGRVDAVRSQSDGTESIVKDFPPLHHARWRRLRRLRRFVVSTDRHTVAAAAVLPHLRPAGTRLLCRHNHRRCHCTEENEVPNVHCSLTMGLLGQDWNPLAEHRSTLRTCTPRWRCRWRRRRRRCSLLHSGRTTGAIRSSVLPPTTSRSLAMNDLAVGTGDPGALPLPDNSPHPPTRCSPSKQCGIAARLAPHTTRERTPQLRRDSPSRESKTGRCPKQTQRSHSCRRRG